MTLGIKLEIEQGSVKKASKEITEAAEKSIARKQKSAAVAKEEKRIRKERGISEKSGKKDNALRGALTGGIIGGFVGAIIGSLKPIQELLQVIGGILQIFLVPILILMKPFLVLFIKLGQIMMKFFSPSKDDSPLEKTAKTAALVGGIALAVAAFFSSIVAFFIALVAVAFLIGFLLGEAIKWVAGKLKDGFIWLVENVLIPVGEWLGEKFRQLGELLSSAWEWIKSVSVKIWNWIVIGFKAVLDFGKKIWDWFVTGLSLVADFGTKIWDLFLDGLKSLANLGTLIWDFIKSKLPFGGGSDTSNHHEDALITSSGQVHDFNPNDNFLAFQDFSQIENIANQTGGGRGNVTFNFPNYLGDKDELMDMIATGLSERARGGITNF